MPSWPNNAETPRQRLLLAVLLVLLVLAAYATIWKAGFVWDDDQHLTQNPCIVGPLSLKEAWTTPEANYFPLVLTNFAVLHALFGLNPLAYHVSNLLLHVANTLLFWVVLRRLGIRGAWLGAALWGLHPVMAETAAWVSETTNTQSCCFFLLSLWAFLAWLRNPDDRRRPWWYTAALLCAAGAMLSKPSTVMLPAVFLLCGWWLGVPWRRKTILALIPFFAFALAWSGWTVWEQKVHSGASGAEWALSLVQRALLSGYDVWFYLGKVLWPVGLSFVYPHWIIDARSPLTYLPFVAALAAGVYLYLRRTQLRAAAFAAAAFGLLLFPVLGFFNVYYFRFSYVADHFQYLASMAPLAFVGAVLASVPALCRPRVATATGALAVITLATLTYFRAAQFVDEKTLWRATLAQDPNCWMAHGNLGLLLQNQPGNDHLTAAIDHYRTALRLKPDYLEAHYNLANALAELPLDEHADEAIAEYETALRIDPTYARAHENLASLLAKLPGHSAEALTQYEAAIRLQPEWGFAHSNYAVELAKHPDRVPDAIKEYEIAQTLDPNNADLHYNYGNALLGQPRRHAEAIAEYRRAIELNPKYGQAHFNLAVALAAAGDYAGAIAQFDAAFPLLPADPNAHLTAATLLDRDPKNIDRTIAEYEAALQLNPNIFKAHNDVAVLYAKLGKLDPAARHLEAAVRLDPNNATAKENLAAVEAALTRR